MIKPLKDRVLIKLIEKAKETSSGIILSRADPTEANRATVISIGTDVTEVSVDEVILPNWNKATKSSIDDEDFYIIKEEDIVLVFGE